MKRKVLNSLSNFTGSQCEEAKTEEVRSVLAVLGRSLAVFERFSRNEQEIRLKQHRGGLAWI